MVDTEQRKFRFLPLSIRVETLGGVATPLVLRGTPLPAVRSDEFSTAADGQTRVEVKLLIGERPLGDKNLEVGRFLLTGIPEAAKGATKIRVEFSVDTTCTISAKASLPNGQVSAEQTFSTPAQLSDALIQKALRDAETCRQEDEAELLRIETNNRANQLVAEAERLLSERPNSQLSQAVAALGLALESDDTNKIREQSDVVQRLSSRSPTFFDPFDFSSLFSGAPQAAKSTSKRVAPAGRSTKPSAAGLTTSSPHFALGKIFGGGSFTLDPQLLLRNSDQSMKM